MLEKEYYSGWTQEWENREKEGVEDIYCILVVLSTVTLWWSMIWLM